MKCGLRWMVLAVAALVSTSAWAVWDPCTDANLLFNMNFQTYSNPSHTATDAKRSIVGTLEDFNTTYPNVFGEASKSGLGVDANFAAMHDKAPGAGVDNDEPNATDCRLTVPTTSTIFDLSEDANKHTWTFWFNTSNLSQGTIIRHASIWLAEEGYENFIWEIRIQGGSLHFYHKNNCLKMQTASSLTDLGIDANAWHSAAIVIDRSNTMVTYDATTQLSTKIYVDGLEVPVIVPSLNHNSMDIDPFHDSDLWIGAGEREFDGLLDDVRLYNRVLTPKEVSIINQPDPNLPRAELPIPRSSEVVITTDVNWVPSSLAVTVQKVYFGTDPCNLPLKATYNDGTSHIVSNATLGGPLTFSKIYYWYVKSTIGGNDVNGPRWNFTSETGRAIDPNPPSGAEDINNKDVNLSWSTPTAATYKVYASTVRSLVESNDVNALIPEGNGIAVPHINGFDPCNIGGRGAVYYWRVNSSYATPPANIPGDIWNFRTKPYELVFNTSGADTNYADHTIPAYGCAIHGDGWQDVTTGYRETDGVAVFDFPAPNGFNYDRRYDIIVVPEYRGSDVNDDLNLPTPLAIHTDGNFYYDGRVQIAGDNITYTTQQDTFARSGGFPGPKFNQDVSVFGDAAHGAGIVPPATYWDSNFFPIGAHGRFGVYTSGTAHYIMTPKDKAKRVFGPGQPVNPPYKEGGGGGAGGAGGDCGRGFQFGVFSGGPSYGDEEVPVPFGGSAGGWGGGSNSPGGAAGGGGIEIVADGDVVFDGNSQIRAMGGGQVAADYPGGGGGGGSVRIIAGGSVTLKGIINANGGNGGNGVRAGQNNDVGGGGGGGRVAVFYGTDYNLSGTITVNGGAKGLNYTTVPPSSLAQNGERGTIFVTQRGTPDLAAKASAPTPANGAYVYCNPDPCTIKLKWYSGYGGTTDIVYCGTNPNPGGDPCGSVAADRGQHEISITVSSGKTYYWKVNTVTDDGNVSSDVWSFKTLNKRCPFPSDGNVPHIAGPEWDYNHDCVLDVEDLGFYMDNWLNPVFGTDMLTFINFTNRFASEWLENDRR